MQTKNVASEEIVRRTDISDKSESSLISFNTDPAVHLIKKEEKKTYGSQSEGMALFKSSLHYKMPKVSFSKYLVNAAQVSHGIFYLCIWEDLHY